MWDRLALRSLLWAASSRSGAAPAPAITIITTHSVRTSAGLRMTTPWPRATPHSPRPHWTSHFRLFYFRRVRKIWTRLATVHRARECSEATEPRRPADLGLVGDVSARGAPVALSLIILTCRNAATPASHAPLTSLSFIGGRIISDVGFLRPRSPPPRQSWSDLP